MSDPDFIFFEHIPNGVDEKPTRKAMRECGFRSIHRNKGSMIGGFYTIEAKGTESAVARFLTLRWEQMNPQPTSET